jgi:hypothetical protein
MNYFEFTASAKRDILQGNAPWIKDREASFDGISIFEVSPGMLHVALCRQGVELAYFPIATPQFEQGQKLCIDGLNLTLKVK